VPAVTPLVGKDGVPVGLMFDDGSGVQISASGVTVLGHRGRRGGKDVARTLSLRR
jgi:hypothetical protein